MELVHPRTEAELKERWKSQTKANKFMVTAERRLTKVEPEGRRSPVKLYGTTVPDIVERARSQGRASNGDGGLVG